MGETPDVEDEEEGNPLDLPEKVESVGHAELARQHADDDDAYEHLPPIARMRTGLPGVELGIEEELAVNVANLPS